MAVAEEQLVRIQIRISCQECSDHIGVCAAEGLSDEEGRARFPAMWDHVQECPTCAEAYAELMYVARGLTGADIPCEICQAQLQASDEGGLSDEAASQAFPAMHGHVQECPVCGPRYAQLIQAAHVEGHLEAHHEERGLRPVLSIVEGSAVVVVTAAILLAVGLFGGGLLLTGARSEDAMVNACGVTP